MQLAVSKNTLILVSILLVTFIFIAAIFLYTPDQNRTISQTVPTSTSANPNKPSMVYPTAASSMIAKWQTYKDDSCKFTIRYPLLWRVTSITTIQGNAPTDYNFGCVVIEPPVETKAGETLKIDIRRALTGSVANGRMIQTIDDYIASLGNESKAENVQYIFVGDLPGKTYVVKAQNTANFALQKDKEIFIFSWPENYKGIHQQDLYPIISTLRFL